MTTDNNKQRTEERAPYQREHSGADVPQIMRNIFGIIMIVVYVGMGILLFINYFGFDEAFTWVRYVGGVLFILYGIWRAYRQIKGID